MGLGDAARKRCGGEKASYGGFSMTEQERNSKKEVSLSGQYEGDAVFAVQYRRIRKSPLNKLTLNDAKYLGPSTFSGLERRDENAEDDFEVELDEQLNEDYLERGNLICSRFHMENNDLLVVSEEPEPQDVQGYEDVGGS